MSTRCLRCVVRVNADVPVMSSFDAVNVCTSDDKQSVSASDPCGCLSMTTPGQDGGADGSSQAVESDQVCAGEMEIVVTKQNVQDQPDGAKTLRITVSVVH